MSSVQLVRKLAFVVLSLLISSPARAELEAIDPIGRPTNFEQGRNIGYAVWFEDDAWEVRMTSIDRGVGKPRQRQVYTGTITFDGGVLADGQFEGLELKKRPKESDWIRVHPGKKGFDFHFITVGATDSFRFKTSRGAKTVKFNLLTSGDDSPSKVRIGAAGNNPSKVPFEFPAQPKAPEVSATQSTN